MLHFLVIFCCVYRPPNSKREFWELLYESIVRVKDIEFPSIFLVGDLNDNYLNETCNLRNLINNCNLIQVIDEPTREPSKTLLDVILTDSPSVITKHGVLAPICSDHKPIYACLNFSNHKIASYKRTVWDFKNANFDNFRDKLSSINWDFIDVNDDIDIITDIFTEKFMGAAKDTIPNKECYIRGKDKPWMRNEIRKQIRIRRRIHRYAKRINSPEYWQIYRVQRNKVTSLVRKSKDEYYKQLTDSINTDHNKSSKSWWRLCKFLYTGKTNQHTIPPIIINDRVLTKDTDKAEAFNEYFTSISKIDNADSEPPEDLNECISWK